MIQVVSFAGDLLSSAEGLLRDGLHTSEVAEGYTKAANKVGPRNFPLYEPFCGLPLACNICVYHAGARNHGKACSARL